MKVDAFTVDDLMNVGFTEYEAGVIVQARDFGGTPGQLAAGAVRSRYMAMTLVEAAAAVMASMVERECHGLPELESVPS